MEACHERVECNRLKNDFARNRPAVSNQRAEQHYAREPALKMPVNEDAYGEGNRDQWL